jgi:hypothetical protein
MIDGVHTCFAFEAHLMLFCTCGFLMSDNISGYYCDNPQCPLKTRLFKASIAIEDVPLPEGAAA